MSVYECAGCGQYVGGMDAGQLAAAMSSHDHRCDWHAFKGACRHEGSCYVEVPHHVCVSCGASLNTLANANRAGSDRGLTPVWMPRGGCQCEGEGENPECGRCFPERLWCQACGDAANPAGQQTLFDLEAPS